MKSLNKKCIHCLVIKPLDCFHKSNRTKDGHKTVCKDCVKISSQKYWLKIKDNPIHLQKRKERKKSWVKINQERRKIYNRNYYHEVQSKDINFKISHNVRTRITKVLHGINKSESTQKLLGCSIEDFKLHLESQFKPGMSWDNYGDWHIDHIRPCSGFDLSKKSEQQKCFHYKNLQPLWAVDNLEKGTKVFSTL